MLIPVLTVTWSTIISGQATGRQWRECQNAFAADVTESHLCHKSETDRATIESVGLEILEILEAQKIFVKPSNIQQHRTNYHKTRWF